MKVIKEFSERRLLNDEIHARAYLELDPPEQVSYIALLVDREDRERELAHLHKLCEIYKIPTPDGLENKDYFLDCVDFRLKVEIHAEFTHYKFFRRRQFEDPFADPVIEVVPQEWLDELPGEVYVAVHVAVVDSANTPWDLSPDSLPRFFGGNRLVGGNIAGGTGSAFSDFMIHGDGFSRMLIINDNFAPGQAGRCLQRLLEIETYRMMALLGLPKARAILPELPAADRQLVDLTGRLAEDMAHSDEEMLAELAQLAAVMENKISATYARFNATRSYASLVDIRLEQLRESKIEGVPTITEFLQRRLNPAMSTCQSVDQWLHQLSQRIANMNQLLLTRIDVRRKQQNQDILESLNRRAHMQLRMQQAIEMVSIAAVTYATVSLIGLGVNGLRSLGINLNADLTMLLSIPVVGYCAYLAVLYLQEQITQESD